MHRRTYLRSVALGAVATVGGCLESGDDGGPGGSEGPDASSASVGGVELHYPQFSPSTYSITGEIADGADEDPIPFADLSHQARVEVANAVARDRYQTGKSPAVLEEDVHLGAVEYRGATVTTTVAVADRFQQPEHGPDGDPDWRDPVAVDASVSGGDLALAVTNELDDSLPVHHYGRPYLGVLIAVGETVATLGHGAYGENEFVRTGDVLRTERVRASEREAEPLSPGESLEASYRLPDRPPEDPSVWLALPIGDDSADLLGNQSTVVAATVTLET